MKKTAPSPALLLRHAVQALLLTSAALPLYHSAHAADVIPNARPLRLENPQDRAALAEQISQAIAQAKEAEAAKAAQKSSRKKTGQTEERIPSLTLEVPPAPPPKKPAAKPRPQEPEPLPTPTRLRANEPEPLPTPTRLRADEPEPLPTPTRISGYEPMPLPEPDRISEEPLALPEPDRISAPVAAPAPTPRPVAPTPAPPPPSAPSSAAPATIPVGNASPASPPPPVSASRRELQQRAAAWGQPAPAAAVVAPPASSTNLPLTDENRWSYQGETGPHAWGRLHESFSLCEQGMHQSPIHITAPKLLQNGPSEPLHLGQQPFGGILAHNGRGIEMKVEGANFFTLRGTQWRLVRVQFRHPAEERIHYQPPAPMATDLLYQSLEGQLAVISVPMQIGSSNPFLAQLWPHLPLEYGDRVRLPHNQLQLHDLLPADRRYYHYLGSLTTPPCTEGVLRIVLKATANVSLEQLRVLQKLAPPNARPPQPLENRLVRESL